MHCAFVISSDWSIFLLRTSKDKITGKKKKFPSSFVDQQIKQCLQTQFNDKKQVEPSNSTSASSYKLPCIGDLPKGIKQKITKNCNCYCNSINIKTVFSSIKVEDMFRVKESLPKNLNYSL